MVVGVSRLVLALPPGTSSLKAKRSVVRRIVERVKSRFHAAIAEVADMDDHRRAVIGVAVVSNDARHATSMMDTIVSFVAGATEAQVIDRGTELAHYGAGLGGDARMLGAAIDRLDGVAAWSDEDGDDDEL